MAGKVLVLRALDSHAQLEVGVGIGAALLDGNDNLLRKLGEQLPAPGVVNALRMLDGRPF